MQYLQMLTIEKNQKQRRYLNDIKKRAIGLVWTHEENAGKTAEITSIKMENAVRDLIEEVEVEIWDRDMATAGESTSIIIIAR